MARATDYPRAAKPLRAWARAPHPWNPWRAAC